MSEHTAHLLENISGDPELRAAMQHEPIKLAEVMARCQAEAAAARAAAETPAPS
jgi:hypothetical protein